MEWIVLAQDRDRRRALVNGAMNLWVLEHVENFLTSCEPVSFSKGLCSMEFVSKKIDQNMFIRYKQREILYKKKSVW